jgi:hypothetical protein
MKFHAAIIANISRQVSEGTRHRLKGMNSGHWELGQVLDRRLAHICSNVEHGSDVKLWQVIPQIGEQVGSARRCEPGMNSRPPKNFADET